MNTKEIAEIRRRFKLEKSNISRIRGCCVNEQREIVSTFNQSLGLMAEEEAEELLAILRKTLSGAPGKNLLEVGFSTAQVLEGEQHKLLSTLRRSELDDEEAVGQLFARISASVEIEGAFMILLAADKYDVHGYAVDGSREEDSGRTFSYFLCSVCPLKQTRAALGYVAHENRFCSLASDRMIAPPEVGFMFPTFDRRAANIYTALYYSRSAANSQSALVEQLFGSELPMPAQQQREMFETVLSESVAESCSYAVAQAVHEQICAMAEEGKKVRDEEEAPFVSKHVIRDVLETCGVDEDKINCFAERFDEAFGANAELPPANLVDAGHFALKTPDVVITVNPESSDLVQTRVIDGEKYIMIRAEAGVEVNGVPIRIVEA